MSILPVRLLSGWNCASDLLKGSITIANYEDKLSRNSLSAPMEPRNQVILSAKKFTVIKISYISLYCFISTRPSPTIR